jgi:hypothetical protein
VEKEWTGSGVDGASREHLGPPQPATTAHESMKNQRTNELDTGILHYAIVHAVQPLHFRCLYCAHTLFGVGLVINLSYYNAID